MPYLFHVSVAIVIFYCLYAIALRRTTFFAMNRIYLLGALLSSFILPVVEFPFNARDYHLKSIEILRTGSVDVSNVIVISPLIHESGSIDLISVFYFIYWIGFALAIVRLSFSLLRVIQLKNKSKLRRTEKFTVILTDRSQPFTFFRWIFLPTHQVDPLIIKHEQIHVCKHHWIDLVAVEIAAVILWFNPFMVLYRRAIQLQHEYQADSLTIDGGIHTEAYLKTMLSQIQQENQWRPVSRFYSQTIKNRIIMMTKKKTSLKFSAVYFLALPIVCLLLVSFAKPFPLTIRNDNALRHDQIVVVVDAGHGGADAGSTSKDGTNEKNITLELASRLAKVAEGKGIKVVLTRTADQPLTLEERVNVTKQVRADAFVSLHADYDQQDPLNSGIDCIVSENNAEFNNSKRLAEELISEFQKLKGIRVNGLKKSNFYVLKTSAIPAVVLEVGYLSNASDLHFINASEHQQEVAEKIVAAISAFKKK